MEVDSTQLDSAQVYYKLAESMLLAGDTTGALREYSNIADNYLKSPMAAKSLYTVGWILENYYFMYDSAYFWYKKLIAEYPASIYAAEVKGKVAVKENPEKISEFIKVNEIKGVPISTKPGKSGKTGVTRQEEENNEDQNPNSRLNRRAAQPDEDEEETDTDDSESDDEDPDEDPGYNMGGVL
jgi:tetratricopeptide (TPR) repeat protein